MRTVEILGETSIAKAKGITNIADVDEDVDKIAYCLGDGTYVVVQLQCINQKAPEEHSGQLGNWST